MKFSKTFCRPSSSVTVVPAGLPLKLQYNEYGLLQKATIGFTIDLDPSYDEVNHETYNYLEFFNRVKQMVPNSISTTGGTTWVYGILYTDRIPCDQGMIPAALYQSYIADIIKGGSYSFYAGYVHSLAASFRGPLIIRNFLSAAKFDLLPQIIVPLSMTDETLQMMMNPSAYPFKYAYIAGFFIFEELECRYSASNLLQLNIWNDPEPFVDEDGYLKGELKAAAGKSLILDYSAIVRHQVTNGSTILIERDENNTLSILSTRVGTGIEKVVENIGKDVKCPVCGKVYRVGFDDAPIQCDDPHCLSRNYINAEKMLKTLRLPYLTHAEYKQLIKEKQIICLPDILELPIYKSTEIKVSLAQAIYSIVPAEVVPDFGLIERFANKCNNKLDTLKYYLDNPLRIETDLDITDPMIRRFVSWLEDPYNVSDLTSILASVTIDNKLQKFDGAPIFRGTTIAITGKFRRGDYPEIKSILTSYAADVIPNIELHSALPNVVVVGSLNESISGALIQKARLHNIPIEYEDEFFQKYEIDQDLAANLL
mgnify:CR=1 FL=1